jgi:hypothetical protein
MIGEGRGPVGAGPTNGAPQIPRLPGFPVESCDFRQLRVVLFERTTSVVAGESSAAGNPGTLPMYKMLS